VSTTPPVPEQAPDEAPDPLVGQLLADRYRIVRKLGEGAMGAVYVGEHLRIGRRDAIKVLRPGLAGDAEAIARFTRGTRNVSAIRHPNVCTIYDFSDTPEGVRYLAMEFVEGDTLKEILDREGRLEVGRAVELTRQVAEALQAAHDAGVVHRDLKPGNIMICRRPDGREQVKVVDFDIAKGPAEAEGEEVTRLGFVVGTPEYMSPEQLMGDRLDGRSDLYSLGVVLFRMLAGSLPFRAPSTQEMMVQRLTGEPLRLQDAAPDLLVPLALEEALRRALAKRAQDRQESAGEFGREVVAALTAAPVPPPRPAEPELAPTRVGPAMAHAAAPASSPTAPAAARKRSPVLIGGVAVVLIGAAAAVGLLLTGRQQSDGEGARPDTSSSAQTQSPGGAVLPVGAAGDSLQTAAAQDTQAPTGPENPAGGSSATQPGPGTDRPATQPSPNRPGGARATLPAGGVGAMLNRQMVAVTEGAAGARLRAVRDSAELGWRLAATRADSAAAAIVLAHAAFAAGEMSECLRWARQAAGLGERSAEMLVQGCR
jgi:serine/threonine-protein kinase